MRHGESHLLLVALLAIGAILTVCGHDGLIRNTHADTASLQTDPGGSGFTPISLESDAAKIRLSVLGAYRGGWYSEATPGSPPAYDPFTRRVFVASADRHAIEALDISDPTNPRLDFTIDLAPYGDEANSLSVRHGILAATVEDEIDSELKEYKVMFFNVNGELLVDPIYVPGGSKIKWTPNGRKVVFTVSGGPNKVGEYYGRQAAIGILDIRLRDTIGCRWGTLRCRIDPVLTMVDFMKFNDIRDELVAAGVRIFKDAPTVAQDLDTSGMTITKDSKYAYVSMGVANAIAEVDLANYEVTKLIPLGLKDNSIEGNGLDASDKDGGINIRTWPLKSMYQPKGVAASDFGANSVIVTANEGNLRNYEEEKIENLTLDSTAFTNAEELHQGANLGRLRVTTETGDLDDDGDFDELHAPGGRSFSIFSPEGELLFDSGDDFEQYTAQAIPLAFNTSADRNELDERSPKKGPEPEHVEVGTVRGRNYAFIASERIGGIMIYDITSPTAPTFQQYINNRNFDLAAEDVCGEEGQPAPSECELVGDLEPEGLLFIPAWKSPIFEPLLVVIHEKSDSTTIYRVHTL